MGVRDMARNYWLDLFTGKTWEEFKKHGANISGFRPGSLIHTARCSISTNLLDFHGDYLVFAQVLAAGLDLDLKVSLASACPEFTRRAVWRACRRTAHKNPRPARNRVQDRLQTHDHRLQTEQRTEIHCVNPPSVGLTDANEVGSV